MNTTKAELNRTYLTASEGFERKGFTDWATQHHNFKFRQIELAYNLSTEIQNNASQVPEHIWKMAQQFKNAKP